MKGYSILRKAMQYRAMELFNRAMFMSGRNNRTRPELSLYAFIPSKHWKIVLGQVQSGQVRGGGRLTSVP